MDSRVRPINFKTDVSATDRIHFFVVRLRSK